MRDEGLEGQTRALIVASEVDGAFCAGADLKERRGFTGEECVLFFSLCFSFPNCLVAIYSLYLNFILLQLHFAN